MVDMAACDMKKYTEELPPFRLGIPVILCLNYWPDLYVRLKEKFPQIEFQITNDGTGKLLEMLENGRLDAVIALTKILISEKINRMQLANSADRVVSMSVHHPLAKEKAVSYEQLLPYPVLGYQGDEVKTEYLKTIYASLGAELRYIQHCNQISTLLQLLKRNVGIAYLNEKLTEHEPELISIPISDGKESVPLCFLWKDEKAANGRIRKVSREIKEYFASLP